MERYSSRFTGTKRTKSDIEEKIIAGDELGSCRY